VDCPSCGKELAGEFSFCPFCGSALAGAALTGGRHERKVVTVLLADLVGFTARAELLDPEDVRALLSPYHAHLRTEELLDALGAHPAATWIEEVHAYVSGNFAVAADILRRTGERPAEAEARLRAADQLAAAGRRAEAEEQLQRAVAFYRSVGATHYLRECEPALAAFV
jgi:hypothetical protein